MSINEDVVKKANGKWTNRGDDGKEHGEFKTKKAADAQRRAIFASGWKGESLKEDANNKISKDNYDVKQITFNVIVPANEKIEKGPNSRFYNAIDTACDKCGYILFGDSYAALDIDDAYYDASAVEETLDDIYYNESLKENKYDYDETSTKDQDLWDTLSMEVADSLNHIFGIDNLGGKLEQDAIKAVDHLVRIVKMHNDGIVGESLKEDFDGEVKNCSNIYKLFAGIVEKYFDGSSESIEKVNDEVTKLYLAHKGEPGFEVAWERWNDPYDEDLDEPLTENIGEDVAKYQKWVDYDMKHYGKISRKTNDLVKKAGLTIIKDKYGDYEVIPYED